MTRVQRVQPAPNADAMAQTLADILGMQATASEIDTRLALPAQLYGASPRPGLTGTASSILTARRAAVTASLNALGVTGDLPDAVMFFTETGYRLAERAAGAVAGNGDAVAPGVIAAIRAATFDALQNEQLDIDGASSTPLYLLLRHSMLLAYVEAAYRIQRGGGVLGAAFHEPVLVDVHSAASSATAFVSGPPERTMTPLRLLDAVVPAVGPEPLHQIIHTLGAPDHADASILDDMRESLDHLATLPVSELDALLRETLDLASHRLDAWVTSLAMVRLRKLRQVRPAGLIVGGYGWVENLRAAASNTVVTPEPPGEAVSGDPLYDAAGNGGYVVAPSLTHASAAAILRAGYLSYGSGGEASAPFAIDLSSDRVRLAQWLLDGVRQGQPLRALLGYRFERALRDNKLAKYIRAFRLLAPFGPLYEAKAEKADLERQRSEMVSTYNDSRARLVTAVNAAQTTLKQATSDLNAKTTLVSQLASEINTLAGKITTQQQQIANLTKDRDSWQAEVNRLASRPPTDERRMEAQAELHAANNALKAAQTTLSNLQTQKDKKSSQHFTAVSQMTGLTTTRNTRQTELNTKKAELTTLDANHAAALEDLDARIAQVQQRIDGLEQDYRERFTKTTPFQSMETIEEQHAVDGLALLRRWQAGEIRFSIGKTAVNELPMKGSADANGLVKQLDALAEAVDAVSDLVTAESVFQLTQGNELRAGATLDAIARGETPPPEPAVVRTPRSGIAHTHRTMVILPGSGIADAWPTDAFERRALAEPALNAWVAGLLPDPTRVRLDAAYLDPRTGDVIASRIWRLSEFFFSPLDAVYLAPEDGACAGSPLEALIAYRAIRNRPAGVAADALVRVTYEAAADWPAGDVDLSAFLEAARAARELLASARPIDARDLVFARGRFRARRRCGRAARARRRAGGRVSDRIPQRAGDARRNVRRDRAGPAAARDGAAVVDRPPAGVAARANRHRQP